MKLSIIVVSYNEAEYLSGCLNSILNQNVNFDYEIIIGDDGSSDNSLEIIKEYESNYPNISHFVQERPKDLKIKDIIPSVRVSAVIFRAMEIAQGEYINVISADDCFLGKNKFQSAVEFLDLHRSWAAYASSFMLLYPDGRSERVDFNDKGRFGFWDGRYIHISCFVFRSFKGTQFLLDDIIDDCGLRYSIVMRGKIKYSNEVEFTYRQRNSSIMHSDKHDALDIMEMLMFQVILNKALPSFGKILPFIRLRNLNYKMFSLPFLRLYKKRGTFDLTAIKKYTDYSFSKKNSVLKALVYPNNFSSKVLLCYFRSRISILRLLRRGLDVSRPEALRIKSAGSFSEKKLPVSLSYLKKKKRYTYMAGEGLIEKGLGGDTVLNPSLLLESGGSYWKIKEFLAGESFAFKAKIEGVFDEFEILLCEKIDSEYKILAKKRFKTKTIKNKKAAFVIWTREHFPMFIFLALDKIRRK